VGSAMGCGHVGNGRLGQVNTTTRIRRPYQPGLCGTPAVHSTYSRWISSVTTIGVLVVASAGKEKCPRGCYRQARSVGGGGLRNVGTTVGYSSFGAEVGIAAPPGTA